MTTPAARRASYQLLAVVAGGLALLLLPLLASVGSGDFTGREADTGSASALAQAAHDAAAPLDPQVQAALAAAGHPASSVQCPDPVAGEQRVRCTGTVGGWPAVSVNLVGSRLVVVGSTRTGG